jgi:hypothetical protein
MTDEVRAALEAAEYESEQARRESDADPENEELHEYAEAAHGEAYWARQALPIEERYPADRFSPKGGK